jgi:hypothetical protein
MRWMEACYGGTDVMESSCAVARGKDINMCCCISQAVARVSCWCMSFLLPFVPLSSPFAVARQLPCSWPAVDTRVCALPVLTHTVAPAGIRPPPARLDIDMQCARPHGPIMPLRAAITRASRYSIPTQCTVPALVKSPEPLLSWVVGA